MEYWVSEIDDNWVRDKISDVEYIFGQKHFCWDAQYQASVVSLVEAFFILVKDYDQNQNSKVGRAFLKNRKLIEMMKFCLNSLSNDRGAESCYGEGWDEKKQEILLQINKLTEIEKSAII